MIHRPLLHKAKKFAGKKLRKHVISVSSYIDMGFFSSNIIMREVSESYDTAPWEDDRNVWETLSNAFFLMKAGLLVNEVCMTEKEVFLLKRLERYRELEKIGFGFIIPSRELESLSFRVDRHTYITFHSIDSYPVCTHQGETIPIDRIVEYIGKEKARMMAYNLDLFSPISEDEEEPKLPLVMGKLLIVSILMLVIPISVLEKLLNRDLF